MERDAKSSLKSGVVPIAVLVVLAHAKAKISLDLDSWDSRILISGTIRKGAKR